MFLRKFSRHIFTNFQEKIPLKTLFFSHFPDTCITQFPNRTLLIFYVAAIKSNTSSTLIFEEPESNIFPYFVTMLAESIGLDKSDNQYFIATHNPYFLLSVLEKAPKDDINVFVTYLDESGTNVKCLTNKEIPELMEHDPFLNLNLFIDKDKE